MCNMGNKVEKKPRIKIQFIGQDSFTIHFKIKYNTPLLKVGRVFAERADLSVSGIRLMYDGLRIDQHATAKSLGLCDNEIIEVYQEQMSG